MYSYQIGPQTSERTVFGFTKVYYFSFESFQKKKMQFEKNQSKTKTSLLVRMQISLQIINYFVNLISSKI